MMGRHILELEAEAWLRRARRLREASKFDDAEQQTLIALAEDCEVRVVPTRNLPQGISALLAFDPGAGLDENVDGSPYDVCLWHLADHLDGRCSGRQLTQSR